MKKPATSTQKPAVSITEIRLEKWSSELDLVKRYLDSLEDLNASDDTRQMDPMTRRVATEALGFQARRYLQITKDEIEDFGGMNGPDAQAAALKG